MDTERTDDKIWILREAAKSTGFCPNAASVAEFAKSLERDGLLRESQVGPFWMITDRGRVELLRLESEQR